MQANEIKMISLKKRSKSIAKSMAKKKYNDATKAYNAAKKKYDDQAKRVKNTCGN